MGLVSQVCRSFLRKSASQGIPPLNVFGSSKTYVPSWRRTSVWRTCKLATSRAAKSGNQVTRELVTETLCPEQQVHPLPPEVLLLTSASDSWSGPSRHIHRNLASIFLADSVSSSGITGLAEVRKTSYRCEILRHCSLTHRSIGMMIQRTDTLMIKTQIISPNARTRATGSGNLLAIATSKSMKDNWDILTSQRL